MSYLALARKWRPTQFKDVVGQAHVLTALENALRQNKLHHAYLFSGTRGVGKTTIGRLFAKGLNCETGITATPCGHCDTCREIDEGRFVDLLEIDAASRTKVEDIRELLDNVQYKPARGRFKVYLIDEVHMLSRHSFNALLKTLEEPPEHVKFLLATTDPQKLPVTILSRCLQFHLKPISVDIIHEQLDFILQQENVTSEQRALGMIAHAADGSMRDALSLADQAIALSNNAIDTATVANMLGTLDADQAIHLLEAISSKQAQVAMASVQDLAKNGVEWDGLLQELASQLHRIAMYQALPSTLDKSKPDAEKIELLSRALTPQDVQLFYQIALKGRQDLALAPTERMGLEMVVLRMMAFKPQAVDSANAIVLPSEEQKTAQVLVQPNPQPVNQPQQVVQQSAKPHHVQPQSLESNQQQVPQQQEPKPSVQQQPAPQQLAPQQSASQQTIQQPDYPPVMDDYPPEPDMEPYPDYPVEEPSYGATAMGQQQSQPEQSQPEQSQPEQSQQEQQQPVQQPVQQPKNPPLAGLRHQLRSRRNSGSAASDTHGKHTGIRGKKSDATSSTSSSSVLDRVAQHGRSGSMSQVTTPNANSAAASSFQQSVGSEHLPVPQRSRMHQQPSVSGPAETEQKDEPYQWKPTTNTVPKVEKKELKPSEIKQALEHTKTPEMAQKLVDESITLDEWAALIQRLHIPKLVEQLALNSSYRKNGSTIELLLRANQAHLNKDKAQQELLQALNAELAEECHLTVQISGEGQTPLELREKLYQEKLEAAFVALESDPSVQFIQKRFAAELDRDSVRPI